MKAIGTQRIYKIGWIRGSPGYPAAPQIEALKPHCKITYNSTNGDEIMPVVATLREGNELYVHGIDRLADRTPDIREAILAIHKAKAKLFDVEEGVFVDVGALASLSRGFARVVGELRTGSPEEASRRGKLGGKPKSKAKLTRAEALKVWKDQSITSKQAARIIGLDLRTCYRRYKSSGRPAGKPVRLKK